MENFCDKEISLFVFCQSRPLRSKRSNEEEKKSCDGNLR